MLLLVLVLMMLAPYVGEQLAYHLARGNAKAEAEVARDLLKELPEPENRFATVIDAVVPSVVGIETSDGSRRFASDERSYLWPAMPQGTGVIIDDQGHILTNFHVISDAEQVLVRLSDGKLIEHEDVELVGFNVLADIAVLKIDEPDLMPIEFGNSDAIEVGDTVLAIGNPFGLNQTVTSGIISAKGRHASLDNGPTYQEFLQTDAAINPGNSGGPLVNMRGELIGINTAIFGEESQGIGFAIPSHLAENTVDQLLEGDAPALGWLGVSMEPITRDNRRRFHLPVDEGVLVVSLVPNSPAVRAGIRPHDVIVRWGDIPIARPFELAQAIVHTDPGAEVEVGIVRGDTLITITVTVGEHPVTL